MSGYITLTRQSGLTREMQVVANNIANISTTGYRREGLIFSEYIHKGEAGESVSLGAARVRRTDLGQGPMEQTGNTFDFAIEGPGYFMVETPDGQALTRAGHFTPNAAGELVTGDGLRLLDSGGAPAAIPAGADSVKLSPDGALVADGQPIAEIGVFLPANDLDLTRQAGTLFAITDPPVPAFEARILQGFLEGSNVDPVLEIARMIEVQRAYEMGARFIEQEGARRRSVIDTLTR